MCSPACGMWVGFVFGEDGKDKDPCQRATAASQQIAPNKEESFKYKFGGRTEGQTQQICV